VTSASHRASGAEPTCGDTSLRPRSGLTPDHPSVLAMMIEAG
jgi:hypothetical protein